MFAFERLSETIELRMNKLGTRIAIILGLIAVISSGILLILHLQPGTFPDRPHDYLSSSALAFVAVAWMCWQAARSVRPTEALKTILLAAAFLFWAANQLWPTIRQAALFNDIAVALFVLDVFLVMIGWPSTPVAGIPVPPPAHANGSLQASATVLRVRH